MVDYIFRWLGIEFIPGYREENTPQREESTEHPPAGEDDSAEDNVEAAGENESHEAPAESEIQSTTESAVAVKTRSNGRTPQNGRSSTKETAEVQPRGPQVRSRQFARFQADAPACDNCGAITVRNGNCYLCHNCGNSMGCS